MRMVGHVTIPIHQAIFRNILIVQRPVTEFQYWQNLTFVGWQFPKEKYGFKSRSKEGQPTRFFAELGLRITDHNEPGKFWIADAIIVAERVDLGKMAFGTAYDINVSPLHKTSNFRGGFEVSVQYEIRPELKDFCMNCQFF